MCIGSFPYCEQSNVRSNVCRPNYVFPGEVLTGGLAARVEQTAPSAAEPEGLVPNPPRNKPQTKQRKCPDSTKWHLMATKPRSATHLLIGLVHLIHRGEVNPNSKDIKSA